MNNTKHLVNAFWSPSHAPHVDSGGFPCEGDLTMSISDALSSMDIASAIIMCVNFLSSVNIKDSAGKHYAKWPKVPESEVKILRNPGYDQKIAGLEVLNEKVDALRSAFKRSSIF